MVGYSCAECRYLVDDMCELWDVSVVDADNQHCENLEIDYEKSQK